MKSEKDIPIIMTTAKWQLEDKLEWFELWADDYLVKPFDLEELEARIKEVEYILEHATIIEDNSEKGIVNIGSTVLLKYDGEDDVEEYRIVGSQEADPFNNKISNESPIAAAILGKKKGDTVSVDSPNGSYKVKIVKVC